MKLTRQSLEALEIAPELKADLLALFGDVETKETELTALRAKMPTDSQKIVESVDYAKWQTVTAELEKAKQDLAAAMENKTTNDGDPILSAFASFFS